MQTAISKSQYDFYQDNGFVVIENFLNGEELEDWRQAMGEALRERNGNKFPKRTIKVGDDDGINDDADYYSNVFDQIINLWQTNSRMKALMLDARIGKMAADLANVNGIRIWHDQALVKRPWANPTAWHLDTPFWSFSSREALSIWIALDDATVENGCLHFIPGSHKKPTFQTPGITKNMQAIFEYYPYFVSAQPFAACMKAGSASFHNGLCIHGAGANMTPGFRRAMTCAFMPDGSVYNGITNVLPADYTNGLKVGDVLNNDAHNPLIYRRA